MLEIEDTIGFAVRDSAGRTLGVVEAPMYGSVPDAPDALAIRSSGFIRHRFFVPVDAIATIDSVGSMLDLHLERGRLVRFF